MPILVRGSSVFGPFCLKSWLKDRNVWWSEEPVWSGCMYAYDDNRLFDAKELWCGTTNYATVLIIHKEVCGGILWVIITHPLLLKCLMTKRFLWNIAWLSTPYSIDVVYFYILHHMILIQNLEFLMRNLWLVEINFMLLSSDLIRLILNDWIFLWSCQSFVIRNEQVQY